MLSGDCINNIPRLVGGAAANRRMYFHTSKYIINVNPS